MDANNVYHDPPRDLGENLGLAQQCWHMAQAACRSLRMKFDETSPSEIAGKINFMRSELANVEDAAKSVVKHTTKEDCIGCGCMSLSPSERVLCLASENERLRDENAKLAASLSTLVRHLTDGTVMVGIVAGLNLDKSLTTARELLRQHAGEGGVK